MSEDEKAVVEDLKMKKSLKKAKRKLTKLTGSLKKPKKPLNAYSKGSTRFT